MPTEELYNQYKVRYITMIRLIYMISILIIYMYTSYIYIPVYGEQAIGV
jgi:hypothetical protein